ncbi:MAG: hypothetical protein ACR2M5_12690 [Nakamurella sp.]
MTTTSTADVYGRADRTSRASAAEQRRSGITQASTARRRRAGGTSAPRMRREMLAITRRIGSLTSRGFRDVAVSVYCHFL